MKIKKYGIGLLLLGLISQAYATGEGFYLGAQLGQSNLDNKPKDVETGGVPPFVNVKPSNTGLGFRFFMGYSVNQYFGFEGGWTYYSPSKYNTGVAPACGNPQIQATSFDVVGKATLPFSTTGFSVFGKGGLAVLRTSTSGRLVSQTIDPCQNNNADAAIRPVAGIGVGYDLSQNWVVDLSWTRIFSGGDFPNADLIALGVAYHAVDKYCGQFLC